MFTQVFHFSLYFFITLTESDSFQLFSYFYHLFDFYHLFHSIKILKQKLKLNLAIYLLFMFLSYSVQILLVPCLRLHYHFYLVRLLLSRLQLHWFHLPHLLLLLPPPPLLGHIHHHIHHSNHHIRHFLPTRHILNRFLHHLLYLIRFLNLISLLKLHLHFQLKGPH